MKDVVIRNILAEQYICAAKKTFNYEVGVHSDSKSKMLIGHITDMHSDVERFNNAMDLFEHYKPDCVVHTGDNTYWNMSEDFHFMPLAFAESDIPAYICVGNHDTFMDAPNTILPRHECGVLLRNENGVPLTNEYIHQAYVEDMKNIKGDEDKCGYFYVDFEEKGIRLIVLNDYEFFCEDVKVRNKYAILEKQLSWFINVLMDAAKKDLGVIVADHEGPGEIEMGKNKFCQRAVSRPWGIPKILNPNTDVICDIIDAFKHGKALENEYYYQISGQKVKVSCKFEKNGEFIAYLSGHQHADYVGYLKKYPDQLSLRMAISGCNLTTYQNELGETCSDLPRIPGTVSEDCINFYVIDRKNKEITIVRAGACVNDQLEQRLFERFKY